MQMSDAIGRVEHRIPGCITIRLEDPRLLQDGTLDTVVSFLKKDRAVKSIRTNPSTRSLVVSYSFSEDLGRLLGPKILLACGLLGVLYARFRKTS
ncbi:MAG: hypothetical protein AB7T49_11040 [Oligoflexales bacterium]